MRKIEDLGVLPYTLVIVDMQPGFKAACDQRTILAVQEEIENAIALQAAIVFVEVNAAAHGGTDERLLSLVHRYDPALWTVEQKCWDRDDPHCLDSGAKQVQEACEALEFPYMRFRICGVNTHCCVFFTALGLSKRFPDSVIELVDSACNDEYADSQEAARKKFAYYASLHDFANYEFVGIVGQ